MLALLAALAAPQDSLQQDERLEPTVLNAEHQRISLGQINNLYRNGRPSNDARLAGLFVHQHDNTEARPPARALCQSSRVLSCVGAGGVAVVGRGWGGIERSEQVRGGSGRAQSPHNHCERVHHTRGRSCRPSCAQGAGSVVFEDSTAGEMKDWVATSIVNKGLPGMNKGECGVIVDPSAVEVQCSYYADMTSWSTGCDAEFLATSGWHGPSVVSNARETPFPPDQLVDMMKMSQELQSNKTALMNYRTARNDGTGEPDGVEFWLGQYNEVLIDKAQYVSNLPRSVAALFHIEGGDDAESCSCIRQARAAMIARYGSDAQHVLLLKHTPGANTAFVSSACATDQQSDQQGCVSIMPGVDSEWCATTCATSSCPENVCKNCPKADPAKAHSTFVEEVAKR